MLIGNSLLCIRKLHSGEDVTPEDTQGVIAQLREQYRLVAQEDHWTMATRLMRKILDEKPDLPSAMIKELMATNQHGIGLLYNARDLVSCSYRLRQPVDDVIDSLALRSM